MSKNSKLLEAAHLFSANGNLFVCPLCASPMKIVNDRSFICSQQHCFDLTRQGYVNLLPHGVKSKYPKEMFVSRKQISKSGFFDPLLKNLVESILKRIKPGHPTIRILDAGCGEGSHLSQIQQMLSAKTSSDVLGVGIDVAKEGISLATQEPSRTIWCVADLANSPFADRQFQVILNILSPANYAQFQRLLDEDGIVLKVVPEKEYLLELREVFYANKEQEAYSNEKIVSLFRRQFELLDINRVQYRVPVDAEHLTQLVQMTPLSWGASEKQVERLLSMNITEIRVDFAVLIGRNIRYM